MAKPLTPAEAENKRIDTLPDFIIEAVNELLVKNLVNGRATIKQDELVALITNKNPQVSRGEIFEKHWLDFEPLFREAGWDVKYDKPGFNETYNAYWTFQDQKR